MSSPSFVVERRDDHVYVAQEGELRDFHDVGRVQAAVDEALGELRKAIFDNRNTKAPTEELRDLMWRFVDDPDRFDAVAILLQSDLKQVRANMTALGRRVKLKAFNSLEAAQAWLAEQ